MFMRGYYTCITVFYILLLLLLLLLCVVIVQILDLAVPDLQHQE